MTTPLTAAPAEADPIPLSVPEITGRELEYLTECIETGWVSSVGPFVDRFEAELAARVGTRFAVATASGTAAIQVALQLAGVGKDDEVLVSSMTFIAPANAVRYRGAHPVFVDAEPVYWQMDPDRVGGFLAGCTRAADGSLRNPRSGRRVACIVPVHVLGHPCDLDALTALSVEYGVPLVEDATESLGSTWRGRPTGSFGLAGCFSFNGNKIITTGGGGMIATDDEQLARRARYLTTQAKDDPIEYVHREVGYNFRLTNLQAAVGCAQLERLDEFVARKRTIAARYTEGLKDLPGMEAPREAAEAGSNCWLHTVRLDERAFGMNCRELMRYLGERKIQTRPLWEPMHRSAAHAGAEALGGDTADALFRECLSLPCSAGLTDAQQDRVIEAIRAASTSS